MPGLGREARAQVAHVEPRVDPATGARDVRLRLADPAIDVPSGLTVTVNLVIERRDRAISIPRSAILDPEGAPQVRIVSPDDRVAARRITFIDWPAERVIVTSGLKAGERILLDPQAASPGEEVKVRATRAE